jgi:PKD repeat protein
MSSFLRSVCRSWAVLLLVTALLLFTRVLVGTGRAEAAPGSTDVAWANSGAAADKPSSILYWLPIETDGLPLVPGEVPDMLTHEAPIDQANNRLPQQTLSIPGYSCYLTVEETFAALQAIAANYPHLATLTDIGDSWEKTEPGGEPGYDLWVLRLTNEAIPGPKPKLFILSALHAREYAPAELGVRFAQYLVDHYGIDPDVTWLLDHQEIHLLPQSNPDGRKIAEQGYYHRKNTNDSNGGSCSVPSAFANHYGTDLNRNFSFEWQAQTGAPDYCDQFYPGPEPSSEPETQAVESYLRAQFPDQRPNDLLTAVPVTATGVLLDIHSGAGELVLWSWGFTESDAPNQTELQTLGRKLALFNGYVPQQAFDLYPTTGTAQDFGYGDLGLAALSFELGSAFFQDCSTFENSIVPNNIPALVYAAKVARTPYVTPSGPDTLNLWVSSTRVQPGDTFQLSALADDGRYSASGGTEPAQNISVAEYYIDVPPWVGATTQVRQTMEATDGAFDETQEQVSTLVHTAGLSEGRHTLFLRSQDAAGNWGAFSAVFIDVAAGPVADFGSNSPVVLSYPTIFNNLTTGTPPLDYAWDFGDGEGRSTAENPSYTYASTGTFTVTLAVTNVMGSDTVSRTVSVIAEPLCDPVRILALESGNPAVAGETVYLTATVDGDPPVNFVWNFGDGSEPQAAIGLSTTTHIYDEPNEYTVAVEVSNTCPSSDILTTTVSVVSLVEGRSWDTQVYVNEELTGTQPVTVWPGDIVRIEDRVFFSATGVISFSVSEDWKAPLELTLPVTVTAGQISQGSDWLRWGVNPASPNTWYVSSKTFTIGEGSWTTSRFDASLRENTTSGQPEEKAIIFQRGMTSSFQIYLPLISRR